MVQQKDFLQNAELVAKQRWDVLQTIEVGVQRTEMAQQNKLPWNM